MNRLRRLLNIPAPMAVSLATRVLLLGLNFLAALLAARLYGPAAAGQIGLITALLGLTSVLALGGCQLVVLKLLSGEGEDRNAIFTACMTRVLIGCLLVGPALAFVFIPLFGSRYIDSFGTMLVVLLPIILAVNAFRIFFYESLRAREAIIAYNLLLIVAPVAMLMAIIFYQYAFEGQSFSWLVVVAECLGLIAVLALLFFDSRGLKPVKISIAQLKIPTMPYYISSLSVAAYQLDILVLSAIVTVDQLGIYVIATRLAALAGLPQMTAAIGFAPNVSRVYREQGVEASLAAGRTQTKALVPLAAVLGVGLILGGPFILSLFGPEFRAGYQVFLLLVCAHMVLAAAGHAGLLLLMIGHEKLQQIVFVCAAAVMFALLLILVPKYGIIGGGIAMVAATAIRAVAGTVAVHRLTGGGISAGHVFLTRTSARARKRSDPDEP